MIFDPDSLQFQFPIDTRSIEEIEVEEKQNAKKFLTKEIKRLVKDKTSNVLIVVTTNDFCGTDKSQFAIELGDQLGVGRSDKDNGLVFLVKPKVGNARGEVFIAVGT